MGELPTPSPPEGGCIRRVSCTPTSCLGKGSVTFDGDLAQSVERLFCTQQARSSILLVSTKPEWQGPLILGIVGSAGVV